MGSVIDLLKAYCPNPKKPGGMPRKNYVNIKRCLETLIEFVQGPCKENQMSLIDGKFFEVAEGILGVRKILLKVLKFFSCRLRKII